MFSLFVTSHFFLNTISTFGDHIQDIFEKVTFGVRNLNFGRFILFLSRLLLLLDLNSWFAYYFCFWIQFLYLEKIFTFEKENFGKLLFFGTFLSLLCILLLDPFSFFVDYFALWGQVSLLKRLSTFEKRKTSHFLGVLFFESLFCFRIIFYFYYSHPRLVFEPFSLFHFYSLILPLGALFFGDLLLL